jgi:hypothetical protein
MSHLRCPDCGVTVADRDGRDSTKPCPRCLMRTGSIVWMEPRSFTGPETRFQLRGHHATLDRADARRQARPTR